MPGHPVTIKSEVDRRTLIVSFAAVPSVSFRTFKTEIEAVRKAGFLPRSARVRQDDDTVKVSLLLPRGMRVDRRNSDFKRFEDLARDVVKYTTTAIQAGRRKHEVVSHVHKKVTPLETVRKPTRTRRAA